MRDVRGVSVDQGAPNLRHDLRHHLAACGQIGRQAAPQALGQRLSGHMGLDDVGEGASLPTASVGAMLG